MAQIVHVIPPKGLSGHRHQESFSDDMSEYEILIRLDEKSRYYGALVTGRNPDGSAAWCAYLEHPETVVAVGIIDPKTNEFIETKRLKGPAVKPAEVKQ